MKSVEDRETNQDNAVEAYDFDASLATYDGWKGADIVGEPIENSVRRIKKWLKDGKKVVIFTARVWPLGTTDEKPAPKKSDFDDPEKYLRALYNWRRDCGDCMESARTSKKAIEDWCKKHLGQILPVTCVKTPQMVRIWDDRAVELHPNTGTPVNQSHN
jgi:hypothetical protein